MVEHILLMVECFFVLCTTFALVIKTNNIMKEIKIAEKGENFTTVNVGKLNEIKEYELRPMANVLSKTQAAAKCSCFAYNIRQIRSLMMMNL